MKKLIAVVLVVVLTFSFTYVSINFKQETAIADELTVPVGEEESPPQEESQVPGEIPESLDAAIVESDGSAVVDESLPAEAPLPNNESLESEQPYWQTDVTYQNLLDEYEAAVAAGNITNATITISENNAPGLSAEIMVSGREVLSNGTNSPAFDDSTSMHLTPREGYPSAGMTSDRSMLIYKEDVESGAAYEATFFFGSDLYPQAAFTAFRTTVVLETQATTEVEEPFEQEETAQAAELLATSAADSSKEPFSTYLAAFENAFYSSDYRTYVLDASYTIGAVSEDGVVTGSVASKDFEVWSVSGTAEVLTQNAPAPGQTSTYAYLTYNGSAYDAVFLFGSGEEGSAVGGLSVSLGRNGKPAREVMEDYAQSVQGIPNIMPDPTGNLAQELINGSELNPLASDIYVGYVFSSTLTWAGGWNGAYHQGIYGGTYSVSMNYNGGVVTFYALCINPGLYGPETISYAGRPVTCTVTGIDRANNRIYIRALIHGPYGYQSLMGFNIPLSYQFAGDLHLIKTSAAPSVTKGNDCYDLTGAQYGLYASWADASNDKNRLHTYTINNNETGYSNPAYNLANKTYYLKELVAPKGYHLDSTIYTINHNSSATYFTVKDVPLGDPLLTIVQKLDTTTGEAYGKDDPNGYLLADAEFTLRYWDAFYDTIEEAEAAGEPARTWIIKTTNNGKAVLMDSLLVDGSDSLYKDQHGDTLIPLGTLAVQETTPPPGYLLPDPNPVSVQQIKETGDPLEPVTRLNTVIVEEEPHVIDVEKLDSDTSAPVPNTEFTLYRESAPGAGDWTEVSVHVTDEFGKCTFSPVAVGSYMLDETRPNPEYAELEESGDSAHYFTIEPTSTREAQVFKNDLVQVSIDVYKKTIPLTNTALDGSHDAAGNHVGQEEYLYNFGARNLSNVRVDEFVITDSLEYVTSKGYRMTTLWTGTTPEGMDYDGLMHILYKTNLTSPTEQVSFAYNPMSANPYNANNPDKLMSVSIEPGWRVWQECVSTTTAIRLDVADLHLQEGEYLVGIKAVYGGVVKGFYTGKGWEDTDTPQSYTGDRDTIDTLSTEELDTFTEFELRDWTYAVMATDALLPMSEMGDETVMEGSIRADLFRNWGADSPVLTDIAKDKVETRVITTFSYEEESLGITPGRWRGSFFGLPVTGDTIGSIALALAFIALTGVILLLAAFRIKKRTSNTAKHEED